MLDIFCVNFIWITTISQCLGCYVFYNVLIDVGIIFTFWAILCIFCPSWLIIGIPYGIHILNSIIDVKQCTITWYIDNNKLSYVDEEVNKKIFETIAKHFGELTITKSKLHKLLGMDIYILGYVKVSVFMTDYK